MPLATTTTWLRDSLQRGGALPTDRDLLARFAAGDEDAFAELVRRHGPMVLGVCERALGNRADAEDAYQATFLALADRAGRSDWRESVSGWLHDVAWRTATKARVRAARQRARELAAAETGRKQDAELVEALDEEVRRLPPTLREAVVCCYLQGLTRQQAADTLGWSLRTLERRLEEGRQRLRERLEGRGVAIPAFLAERALSSALGRWWLLAVLTLGLGVSTLALPRPTEPRTAAPPLADRDDEPVLPPGAIARLGETRLRHGASVNHLAFSPDGKLIASSGSGRGVWVWDAGTGKRVRDWSDRIPSSQAAAFSPDGRHLVSAEEGFHIGNLSTGKTIHYQKGSPTLSHSVAWSDNGKWIATAGVETPACLYAAATGELLVALEKKADGNGNRQVAFAPGSGVVAVSAPGRILLLNPTTGEERHRAARGKNEVQRLVFTPDGKSLIFLDREGVYLWPTSGEVAPRPLYQPTGAGCSSLALRGDGGVLAVGSLDGRIRILDAKTTREVRQWVAHPNGVGALAFSPDGTLLISAGDWTGATRRWDPRTGREVNPRPGHHGRIERLTFLSGGKQVLSLGSDQQAVRWDLTTSAATATALPVRSLWAVRDASPDGRVVALGHAAALAPTDKSATDRGIPVNAIGLFDGNTGDRLRVLEGHRNVLLGVAFSRRGKELASCSEDGTIRLWDVATGRQRWATELPLLGRMRGSMSQPLAFSADDRLVLNLGIDNIARLFDAATGRVVHQLAPVEPANRYLHSAAFSPDGKRVAISTGNREPTVVLWDTKTGTVAGSWPEESKEVLRNLLFSPDGRYLASSASLREPVIKVWDVAAGKVACQFPCERGSNIALAFTPDGRALACGGGDGTILLWDVTGRHGKPSRPLPPERLQELWTALADADAKKAHAAVWELALSSDGAVPFLRTRLSPVKAADAATLDRLVQQLDDDAFAARERASQDLAKLGGAALPRLRQLLAAKPSPEARRRAEAVLARHLGTDAWRQARRAVAVLEAGGSSAARDFVEELARGAAGAPLTDEALAVVARGKLR